MLFDEPSPENQENPQVRLFLDRAAAVVAQCGGVNAKSRILLGQLARELGLSRSEAEPAIRTLLVANEDFSPKKSNGRAHPPAAPMIPINPPKPPPLPRTALDSGIPGVAMSESEALLAGEPPVVMIDDDTVLQNYLDKAAYVLAQHGGWSPKTRVILEQLARSMGITPREMDAALASLRDAASAVHVLPDEHAAPPASAAPPPLPPAAVSDGALAESSPAGLPPVSGLPPIPGASSVLEPSAGGPPPLPKPRPQVVFRAYLHKAIDDLQRPRINPRRERRLIEQGVHKLGLSSPLARQMVAEVAAERGVVVESHEQDAAGPAHDPRQAEFLARARAIIAEQRGVTVQGQVKLAAAARELGLTDEEPQHALSLLQEGAAPQTAEALRRQERLTAFRESLAPALDRLPRKIITPDVVAELVECGVELHGVERAEAERAVRDMAAARGVRFISQQRAVEHLARLVSDKMAGSAVLHAADRQRIYAEGAQWGLSGADIEAIVLEQIELNRRLQAARRRRTGLVMAVLSAAAAVLVGVGAWMTLDRRARETPAPDSSAVVSAPPETSAGGRPASPPADHWWDVDLSVAVARAETELPGLKAALREVRSHSPEIRAGAYEKFVAAIPQTIDSRTATAVLKEMITGCYALDPSDVAADRLRERLMQSLPAPDAPLPADDRPFREAFAAAQMATAALARDGIPAPRADALQRSLERAVGLTIDPAWDEVELHRRCMAAVTQMLYRIVIAAASAQPLAVQSLHTFVTGEARRYLDVTALERLDAQFLQTLLLATEEVWREYQEVILRVVNSAEPAVVLQAVEILERANDDSLRYYVAAGLARRIGLPTQSRLTEEEVAAAVRERFGARAAPALHPEDALRRFLREADESLARGSAGADQPAKLLEETANLARVAALGCALAQGELGRGAFEQLAAAEPLALEKPAAEPSARAPAAAESASPRARMVARYVESLGRASHPVQRIGFLRGVTELAEQTPEVSPEEGDVLARYLLAPKPEEEREAIAAFIPQVGRWKTVRLAMADVISQTPVRQDLVLDVVTRVLGRAPEINPAGNWRQELRLVLMRSVAERSVAPLSSHPFDVAQETMLAHYQAQAKLRGAPASASEATSPTAVLRPLIEHAAAALRSRAAGEDQEFLANLPHEMEVAEYLGDNDLRLLVLLERIWLRLLALEISQARADRAADADAIVHTLYADDRAAEHILIQARNGQAALVRLWRLRVE